LNTVRTGKIITVFHNLTTVTTKKHRIYDLKNQELEFIVFAYMTILINRNNYKFTTSVYLMFCHRTQVRRQRIGLIIDYISTVAKRDFWIPLATSQSLVHQLFFEQ
jgi:hypothetical protein